MLALLVQIGLYPLIVVLNRLILLLMLLPIRLQHVLRTGKMGFVIHYYAMSLIVKLEVSCHVAAGVRLSMCTKNVLLAAVVVFM